MGKLLQQRHNRIRMTLYNISKAAQSLFAKDSQIENLLIEVSNLTTEVSNLKQENLKLCAEKEEALVLQNDYRYFKKLF